MELHDCYSMLEIAATSSNDEVVKAYKALARKYHPDKNPQRLEWAHEMMTRLNDSYATVMVYRFKSASAENGDNAEEHRHDDRQENRHQRQSAKAEKFKKTIERDVLIARFVKNRETTKEALYKYFQYNLHNLAQRDSVLNRGIFNEVVYSIKKNYHAIRSYTDLTDDTELIEHFTVFTTMILTFYRASECLNILDSYGNPLDVEAYRQYKRGDEALHIAHKELFYDRHNRGIFKKDITLTYLMKAGDDFRKTLRNFPGSTWSVETNIKLEYVTALKEYLELFFTE